MDERRRGEPTRAPLRALLPARLGRCICAALLSLPAVADAQTGVEAKATLSAARSGDAAAQYRLGEMYDLGRGVAQDYAQAVAWYRRAAEQGHAPAQFALAEMYKNGDGVPKDMQAAVRWYRRAADNGSAGAQLLLGVLHEGGTGVRQDYVEAARWYRQSAEQGDARAQLLLANLYQSGQGVPRSLVAAYALYTVSADSDPKNNPSLGHRAQMARTMTATDIAAAQKLATDMARPGKLGDALDHALQR